MGRFLRSLLCRIVYLCFQDSADTCCCGRLGSGGLHFGVEGKRIFADEKELTNYLYRACYNNTLLYIRNHQIHDVALSKMLEAQKEEEDRIYALTVKEEIIRQLYQHINDLPPEQRRIILLRIEGFTWEEIAEQLKVSINTVKTQKTRSYRFLRERMGDSMSFILFLF